MVNYFSEELSTKGVCFSLHATLYFKVAPFASNKSGVHLQSCIWVRSLAQNQGPYSSVQVYEQTITEALDVVLMQGKHTSKPFVCFQ